MESTLINGHQIGHCKKCGAEVSLHWIKPLSEITLDSLATIQCKEKHPHEIVQEYGACIYCGQAIIINCYENETLDEKNRIATLQCHCPQASKEYNISMQIDKAKERVYLLFGELADNYGFVPLISSKTLEYLEETIVHIARREMRAATIQISGHCKAKISLTTKGTIKVERSETTKYQLEE